MAWGDGRIFKQPKSKYWHAQFFVGGKRVRITTKTTDHKKALKFLQARVAEARTGEYVPRNRLRLHELLDLLVSDYEAKGRRTIKNLRYRLHFLLDYFGERRPVGSITTAMVNRYIGERRRLGASQSSIRGEVHFLARAFRLAVQARIYHERQVPYVPQLPPDPSRVRQGFLSLAELDLILPHLKRDVADVVEFLFFAPWRKSEALSLEWRDVDDASGAIRLRGEKSKTSERRIIPIAGGIAEVIERRKTLRAASPFVFHRNGKQIKSFDKGWHVAVARAGLPRKILHDLRRSGVKHYSEAGVDQRRVMALSGHNSADIFRRYQIVDLSGLRSAVEMGKRPPAQEPISQAELPFAKSTNRLLGKKSTLT